VVHFLTNGLLPQFTKGLFGTTHRAAFDEAMPNGDFRNGFSTKGQWVNELGTVPKKVTYPGFSLSPRSSGKSLPLKFVKIATKMYID
jgi:hypothetical protein